MKVAKLPKTSSSVQPRFIPVTFWVVIRLRKAFQGCFLQRKLTAKFTAPNTFFKFRVPGGRISGTKHSQTEKQPTIASISLQICLSYNHVNE